ncbi:polyisoprenoid-binding protein [Ktedonosporobacter rubrisoli]|uniref:Polyisoprenoid-binding protein n=1 Tax=Ktedonosporobacter rubrisoli TaxID=2509675 RepID=A0A4P6JYQ2_KTERU|nr:YceI family protein [Ktedonosporobacter rubrisoli]QBD80844.1 polyisoprenoid-binding protein [Ktedonosporobacter rubrisoli]
MVWTLDTTHSEVTFSIRHMMFSKVSGSFNVFKATLEIDEEHPENSWVQAEAEVASINTREEKRDAHLRSADFFDADKYPLLTFKSKQVLPKGGRHYDVVGDLTLHGVTREVTFDVEYGGQIPKASNPFGDQRAGLTATTTINRKDFGLTWNFALETGGIMVGEEVKIEINLEAVADS